MDMFQHLFQLQLKKEMDIMKVAPDDELYIMLSIYVEAVTKVQESIGMGFTILEEAKGRREGLRMILRHLIEVKRVLEHHGRESLEAAGSRWDTIIECWSRRNGPALDFGPIIAFPQFTPSRREAWLSSRGMGIVVIDCLSNEKCG
jgi:hypothetical protein